MAAPTGSLSLLRLFVRRTENLGAAHRTGKIRVVCSCLSPSCQFMSLLYFHGTILVSMGRVLVKCVSASRLTCKMRLSSASVRRTLPTSLMPTAALVLWPTCHTVTSPCSNYPGSLVTAMTAVSSATGTIIVIRYHVKPS